MNNNPEFEKVKSTIVELVLFYNTLPETRDEYIYMCKSVINYWGEIFVRLPRDIDYNFEEYEKRIMDVASAYCYNDVANQMKDNLIHKMKLCTDYSANKGLSNLEVASAIQHDDWKDFMKRYTPAKVQVGNIEFDADCYCNMRKAYSSLDELSKDKHREMVAGITNEILKKAKIDYEPREFEKMYWLANIELSKIGSVEQNV